MAALTDVSVGIANEATPKTYATPTRWWEVMDPELNWAKHVKQGKGMRVGTRVDRSGRRVVTGGEGTAKFGLELVSKGMGLAWESCTGSGTSTLVAGSTYQQLFTLLQNSVTIPSRTIQSGTVDATGTVQAMSLLGCMVDSWELEIPNDDIATLTINWDAMDYTTAQAYAAPSYATAPTVFHFGLSAFTLGGAVTVPTATALATGGTAAAYIRSLKLTGENNTVKDRFNGGGAGRKSRQLVGAFTLKGELELEYVDNVVRDAYLADTELALTSTLTSTEALSTGFAQFQLVLPAIKLNGDVPNGNGDLPIIKAPFDVLDNLTAANPLYIAHRTADTAL